VAGAGTEVERREALSVVAARLPGVDLHPFHLEETPRHAALLTELTGVAASHARGFVLMVDPLSLDAEALLKGFDAVYPGAPKVGGLLSGLDAPGDGVLFFGDRALRHGAIGLGLSGRIELRTLVAQGCRPIGEPMIITRCRDSVIYELNVGRPVDALQRLIEKLEPRDQELCRHSLFVGVEMSGGSHRYGQGDFLVRTLAGLEPNKGAMALHGRCDNYQVVQFMLRDARTSAQDLELRLSELQRVAGNSPRAALLFSCVGRGQELYGVPNHDSDLFCRHFGALPLGGFFASGEIGPVAGQTFLHGYTSVFGVVSEG
jgi:small ligand-binding sensory domain FIST